MENPADPAAVGESEGPHGGAQPRRRRIIVALWLAIATLVITAALFPLFSVVATYAGLFLVLRLLAAGSGLVALALALYARKRRYSENPGNWSLGFGSLGLLLNLVLVVAIVIGVATVRPSLAEVELRAEGGPTFTVTFDDDVQSNTMEWQWDGWAHFNTAQQETEITVVAPEDDHEYPVSCTIIWDGEVVSQETSDSRTVTCRYEK